MKKSLCLLACALMFTGSAFANDVVNFHVVNKSSLQGDVGYAVHLTGEIGDGNKVLYNCPIESDTCTFSANPSTTVPDHRELWGTVGPMINIASNTGWVSVCDVDAPVDMNFGPDFHAIGLEIDSLRGSVSVSSRSDKYVCWAQAVDDNNVNVVIQDRVQHPKN